ATASSASTPPRGARRARTWCLWPGHRKASTPSRASSSATPPTFPASWTGRRAGDRCPARGSIGDSRIGDSRFGGHRMGRTRRLLLALMATALLVLAGCGGSSHRHFEPWEAEGLWSGSTSSGGTFDGVILDTGEYWFIFGTRAGAGSVIHGTGYFRRGRFHSD